MCIIEFDETWTVYHSDVVIAAKDHVCQMCGGRIRKGQPYTKFTCLYDGSWSTEKMCKPCSLVTEDFAADHGQFTNPSGMWELLDQCVDEGGKDDPESRKWFFAMLQMQKRQSARFRADSLAWCPARPPRSRHRKAAHA